MRQVVTGHVEGISALNGTITAVSFTGGSANNWDRLRTPSGSNMTGSQLTPTGAIFAIEGFYRKA